MFPQLVVGPIGTLKESGKGEIHFQKLIEITIFDPVSGSVEFSLTRFHGRPNGEQVRGLAPTADHASLPQDKRG